MSLLYEKPVESAYQYSDISETFNDILNISWVKQTFFLSGYQADTPIAIKAEAIHKADSHCH